MESKAFHICPFCQSPSPASASRCARCDRSLAGLPLPIYGSELDAASMRSEPGDLVDLPLRDGVEGLSIPVAPAVAAAAPIPSPPRVSAPPQPAEPPRATAEIHTVPPDVRAAPVGVERMPDDLRRDSTAGARDDDARADLRVRLDRAEQRRQALTERLGQLRARTNVPVIRDVDEYQRLQEQLSDTLDQLDRVEAQIARLQRALGNGRE